MVRRSFGALRQGHRADRHPGRAAQALPHQHAHTEGSPGLFGFSPQSLFRVYVDNISVTPNGG